MELTAGEVWARWPVLSPLLSSDDPPWRFSRFDSGVLVCVREFESYVDTFWFIEARAGANRRPTPNRSGPTVVQEARSGSVPEALDFLQRSVRIIEP